MIPHLIALTLELLKGKDIELKLYNDIFGSFKQEYKNCTWEILKHELLIDNDKIPFHEIMSIELIATDEERIELIESTDNYYMAFQAAKGHLVGSVMEALDKKKTILKATRKEQIEELRLTIKSILARRGSNLSVEQVLTHLLANTYGVVKNDTAIEKSVLREIYDNINPMIDKLSKVEIF